MGLVSRIPSLLQFYGILTVVFVVFYALMYWGARRNVRELRAMGRTEVEYYYRFIELAERARPVVLPIAAVTFFGGLVLQFLFEGVVARASGLVGFTGYIGLLLIALGWVARKGVEAGERLGAEGVEPFQGPLGLPKWVVAVVVNYAIFGAVFALFWHAGMFTTWPFAPLLWVIAVMALVANPVIIYRRYRSLEEQARAGAE